jgi:hypothetical protein
MNHGHDYGIKDSLMTIAHDYGSRLHMDEMITPQWDGRLACQTFLEPLTSKCDT